MKRITLRIADEAEYEQIKAEHVTEARKRAGIDGVFSLTDYLRWAALRQDWRELIADGKRILESALSEAERNLVRDAANGLAATVFAMRSEGEQPSRLRAARYLMVEVEDSIRLNKYDQHHGVNAQELMCKLAELPLHARLALVEDVLEFWAQEPIAVESSVNYG